MTAQAAPITRPTPAPPESRPPLLSRRKRKPSLHGALSKVLIALIVWSIVRTILRSGMRQLEPTLLSYQVTGDGFLRYMVRALTGTLVEVGRGWRDADSMTSLLAGGRRSDAGATAPPHGLFLVSVDYH